MDFCKRFGSKHWIVGKLHFRKLDAQRKQLHGELSLDLKISTCRVLYCADDLRLVLVRIENLWKDNYADEYQQGKENEKGRQQLFQHEIPLRSGVASVLNER